MDKKFFDYIIHGGDYNPDRKYTDVVNGGTLSDVTLPVCGYSILK